jgi:hypothetical protein
MKIQNFRATNLLSLSLIVALSMPLELWPQSSSQPGTPSQAAPATPTTTQPQTATPSSQPSPASGQSPAAQQPPQSGVTVNPSQPPLQPQPVTTYPDAAGNQQEAPDAPQPKVQPGQAQGQQTQSEPQGAATAERVPTAGGAAAKPAGVAIAPPKQHQTRSLLIKLGAVVAGAAAVGTIYALSKATPSTPPGANGPGAIQKRK